LIVAPSGILKSSYRSGAADSGFSGVAPSVSVFAGALSGLQVLSLSGLFLQYLPVSFQPRLKELLRIG
jgi:hypothetical protein